MGNPHKSALSVNRGTEIFWFLKILSKMLDFWDTLYTRPDSHNFLYLKSVNRSLSPAPDNLMELTCNTTQQLQPAIQEPSPVPDSLMKRTYNTT